MDTIKVGNYLAQLRREQGLTQEQLGEKIGVTNKTISRWETGSYMPPVDALQQLSELYGVSINEILCGKKLEEAEYKTAAETNLKAALRSSAFTKQERFAYFKKKWEKEHAFSQTLAMLLIIGALIAGCYWKSEWLFVVIIAAFAWSIYSYNRMMAYIERHIYPSAEHRDEE